MSAQTKFNVLKFFDAIKVDRWSLKYYICFSSHEIIMRFEHFIKQKQPPKVFCKKVLRSATLLKKRLWHRRFPVSFAKFSRTPFLQNTYGRLVLGDLIKICYFFFKNESMSYRIFFIKK